MTSTYRPAFFPLRTVPPFLACGCPNKSSILLASLMAVAGLDGGAEDDSPSDGARIGIAVNAEASSVLLGSAAADEKLRVGDGGSGADKFGGLVMLIGGKFTVESEGGVEPRGKAGTGGVGDGVGTRPAALTARDGGPRGGGAFGAAASDTVSPAFLLIHFFKFES